MPNVFSDIGRSGALGPAIRSIQRERALGVQAETARVVDARANRLELRQVETHKENLTKLKQQNKAEEDKITAGNRLVNVRHSMIGFPGGPDGELAKLKIKWAKEDGVYVDKDGEGYIRAKDQAAQRKLNRTDPIRLSQRHAALVADMENNYNSVKTLYDEEAKKVKESGGKTDKLQKLKAQLDAAEGQRQTALGANEGLQKFLKTQETETTKTPTQKRVWDTVRQKYVFRSDEQIAKSLDRYGQTKETVLEIAEAKAQQTADIQAGKPAATETDKILNQPGYLINKTKDRVDKRIKNTRVELQINKELRDNGISPTYNKSLVTEMLPSIREIGFPLAEVVLDGDDWVIVVVAPNGQRLYLADKEGLIPKERGGQF